MSPDITGVGPVTALTLAVEINPIEFESGRNLAAWVGPTPKEQSTGEKQRMGGSKYPTAKPGALEFWPLKAA
jgi:transposase